STYSLADAEYSENVATDEELYSFDTITGEITLEVVADNEDGIEPENFTELDGVLYFSGNSKVEIQEIYNSRADAWFKVAVPVVSLFKLDSSGVEVVEGVQSVESVYAHDGKIFMNATTALSSGEDDVTGQELAIYDPATGEVVVHDLEVGASATGALLEIDPSDFITFKGDLYFVGDTEQGVTLVKYVGGSDVIEPIVKYNYETNPGNLNPKYLTVHGDKLYFQGYDGAEYKEHDDPTFGYYNELFVYDGVNAPRIVTNLRVGASASPSFIASVNNELLMYANNGSTGNELFKLATETASFDVDGDSDGVMDVVDAFPNDAAASADTDGDGYPDALVEGVETSLVVDAFPNDATEFADTDGDGVGNNADAFPLDAAASVDEDSDGFPDSWNAGKTEADTTTGLVIDEFPADIVDTDMDGTFDQEDNDDDGDGYSDELELEFGSDPIVASSIPYQKIELASDIRAGSSSSTPKYFTEFNGKTYFQANGGTNGIELYVYDGTSTELVFDIRTGTSSSSPVELVVNATGDTMYFVASDGTDKALWSLSDVDGAVPVKVA
ncbi:hypothetical protein KO520_09045, partial [Psychrosphaera sp. I2R16]|nr:hypothetical protein [Psychrosphaera sp. I2R16]